MSADRVDPQRPLAITLLCVILFPLFALMAYRYVTVVVPVMGELFGPFFAVYGIINFLLAIVAFVGYWRMARWGVYLYGFLVVFGNGLTLVHGIPFRIPSIVGELVVLGIGVAYHDRMHSHL